ncbi:1,3-beta-glucan synthase component FKS3 [Talaromyces islandicus]|uniref:1,3-beta-glucan synthase component FKS3 n=1 Tax=Talaromyces islandicus TaxID=28573 RepID=A0A0U1LR04_TALIS|nr:1,3-beta-glucan synthase component FKS3 [Talaromyces islandicus]
MKDRRPVIWAVSIVIFVLATISVALYATSALFVTRKFKLADYLMVLAWVLDCGLMASIFFALANGFGLHEDDINPEHTIPINKSMYAFHILYDLTPISTKSSILVFFFSLTKGKKVLFRANYALLFIVIAVGLALTITQVFQCRPVSAVFELEKQSKETCTNIFITAISTAPYNIATDIALLVIPIPLLTRIGLPYRQRLILVAVFGTGYLVIVADIVRIVFLQNKAKAQLKELHSYYTADISNYNETWYSAYSIMWSVVEVNATIICACAPSLKPLAARFMPFIMFKPREYADKSPKPGGGERKGREETPSEMMEILTRKEELELEGQSTTGNLESYPGNIRLLNLLNLRPRNMLVLNSKRLFPPNCLVTTLFFAWGTAFGFVNILGARFGQARFGPWESIAFQSAYFLGYVPIPLLVGRRILKRLGFTAAFISGLYIYALGTLIFWPAAVLVSFPLSFISNLIIGSGLGILELTANLFISICGPLEYAESRLLTAQGFQGIGSLISRLAAGKLLLPHVNQIDEVISVQWVFLTIALLDVLLAVCFYYLPVPEAPDKDLDSLAQQRPANNVRVLGFPVIYVTIVLGVSSQFLQEMAEQLRISSSSDFLKEIMPNSKLSNEVDFDSVGSAVWTWARFFAAYIQWKGFKPRWTLLICFVLGIIFSIICLTTTGAASITAAILLWGAFAPIFPIIFAISMRGMGVHTKTASSFVASSLLGGFFAYFARYGVTLSLGEPNSYILVIVLLAVGMVFPLYLNLVPAARSQVDPIKDEYLVEE